MKTFLIILYITSSILVSGCTNNNNSFMYQSGTNLQTGADSNNSGQNMIPGTDDIQEILSGLENDYSPKEYILSFTDTGSSLSFPLNTGDTIHLLVQSPTPKTTIRVSQIISPDGNADGPFSSDTIFTPLTGGVYTFIIRTNLMASEEAYTGNIKVNVTINPYQE